MCYTCCVLSYCSYTAEPSDLHEFAEDKEPLHSILSGDLHHTHKQGNHAYPQFILYSAKHLRGKTSLFRVENGYSLENFHSSMLVDLYCQSKRSYFVGKDLRLE